MFFPFLKIDFPLKKQNWWSYYKFIELIWGKLVMYFLAFILPISIEENNVQTNNKQGEYRVK